MALDFVPGYHGNHAAQERGDEGSRRRLYKHHSTWHHAGLERVVLCLTTKGPPTRLFSCSC